MPLYQLQSGKVDQIKQVSFPKERELQQIFETNLESLLAVRFVASEYTTGDRQRGRIDTLGLDQDGSPVIVEYKKASNDNVINQGLFYLDWLIDHKGDFTLIAQKTLGKNIAIDWSRPRLILIAESFSEYDKFAVNRIGANMELWTFRRYGDNLLHLETIYVADTPREKGKKVERKITGKAVEKEEELRIYSIEDHLKGKPDAIRNLYEELREKIFSLAEAGAIIEKANKHYMVYKHGKNFCEVWLQNSQLKIWLDIPMADLNDPMKLAKDVSNIGHWGTGDVEVNISDPADLAKIMDLISQSYQQTV